MKKLFIVCAMLLTTTVLYAQENISVIKLKSGVEVKGTIIEEVPGESLSIKTTEGDIFIYRQSEIARVENPNLAKIRAEERRKEAEAKLAKRVEETKVKLAKKVETKASAKSIRKERALGNFKGYRGIVEASVGVGVFWDAPNQYYDKVSCKLSVINGYNFGPYFYLGAGVGWRMQGNRWPLDYNDYHNSNYRLDYMSYSIPIFLHLRTSWAKNCRVSPYFSLNVGYNLAISKEIYGYSYLDYYKPNGVLIEPSLGVEIRISRKMSVSAAVTMSIIPQIDSPHDNSLPPMPLGASVGFSF